MRHIMINIIAIGWMAAFAPFAIVSTLFPEHGILAAPSFFGAAPTPDADLSGGGLLAAGFLSFALAVAGARRRVPAAAFSRDFLARKRSAR